MLLQENDQHQGSEDHYHHIADYYLSRLYHSILAPIIISYSVIYSCHLTSFSFPLSFEVSQTQKHKAL